MFKFFWKETEVPTLLVVILASSIWFFLNTKIAEKYYLIYLIPLVMWVLVLFFLFYILTKKLLKN
jgi:membrane protease YdiL (CAAX protease family)